MRTALLTGYRLPARYISYKIIMVHACRLQTNWTAKLPQVSIDYVGCNLSYIAKFVTQ